MIRLLPCLFQLSGSSDIAGNAVKILDVLIKFLVTEHIDYAVEIGLQGQCLIMFIQSNLDILNSDISNSVKLEASI